jgi:hypothetical protein
MPPLVFPFPDFKTPFAPICPAMDSSMRDKEFGTQTELALLTVSVELKNVTWKFQFLGQNQWKNSLHSKDSKLTTLNLSSLHKAC